MGAFKALLKRVNVPQITISAYNSRGNGVVERGHFIIREAITKASGKDISSWPDRVHHAFFADKVATSQVTGFSPYYLIHGVHPVLPFDLTEATFMVTGFKKSMSSSDLLALRIRQLERRSTDIATAARSLKKHRLGAKEQFERRFQARLIKRNYQPRELVLMRNSAIETSHNAKTLPRYMGPYMVVRQTRQGSYVLQELDGTIMRTGVAQFRVIPYIARNPLAIAELSKTESTKPVNSRTRGQEDDSMEETSEASDSDSSYVP
ncbi:hypothetical protein BV25DRAFT_1807130 [Artomyces pyxidatus]|uniref:Uncharacterized protein n=1 Tax=Artomyces pyxidatus TaxID=48021 RepID=A0ACB8SY45_9AGAM|nr:hypothetical protein BV25DRAFT_1807130 [Artomyces pyxidatus]